MASYVDGFVLPIPKKNADAYRRIARKAGKIWREHGALASFPQSVKLKADEVVWFSYIVFKSRRHRDRVNAAVMNDPRIAAMGPEGMPFDGKRMIYGGFKAIVEL